MQIESGLLSAVPRSVIVLPVLFEDQVKAVIELASLDEFTPSQRAFLEQLSGSIGIVLNTIEATMRTERLLSQSQQLAGELQSQQNELQQTNEDIALKATLLAEQKAEVERKNQRDRAGPPRARGEGGRAGADLALQVRVPRQHVARAAHAAQLDPDPRPAAGREPGREPQRRARSSSPRPSMPPAPTCCT